MHTINLAKREQLPVILDLQIDVYQSKAESCHNPLIPLLTQTLAELNSEFEKGIVLIAVDEVDQIIGSVRGDVEGETGQIGKLLFLRTK